MHGERGAGIEAFNLSHADTLQYILRIWEEGLAACCSHGN